MASVVMGVTAPDRLLTYLDGSNQLRIQPVNRQPMSVGNG
jgi:hypothetical protein